MAKETTRPAKAAKRGFGKDSRDDDQVKRDILDKLVREIRRADDFIEDALENYRYYYAHQGAYSQEPELFAININQTRGGTDRKVAKLLDALPQMEIEGTTGHAMNGGEEWDDFLDWQRKWTGDFNDAWLDHMPKIVFQSKMIGEGMGELGYDISEAGGQGQVVGKYSDAINWIWSSDSQSSQLRDAEMLWCVEPKRVDWLREEYPEHADAIHAQGDDWLRELVYKGLGDIVTGEGGGPVGDDFEGALDQFLQDDQEPLAWRIRCWRKRRRRVTRYYDADGQLVTRPAREKESGYANGRVPAEKDYLGDKVEDLEKREIMVRELWESVVAGDVLVAHRLSPYDRSRGGCGHFPIARLSNIWDPRRPKAHGDVEFEKSFDDLASNVATRWVEALFIGNAHWVDVVQGAYGPQEEFKLEMLGERSFQKVKRYPGMPAAEIRGVQTSGPNLFAAGMGFLQELADDARKVYKVNKGGMPYQTSGRGIRQLLAEAAVVENLDRQRMESFLRQEAYLRIAFSVQFMGQPYRLIPINNERTHRKYLLAVGDNRDRVKARFDLEELLTQDKQTQEIDPRPTRLYRRLDDPNGEHVKILAMDEYGTPGSVQVNMRLASGQERSKAEKLDLIELFTGFAAQLPPEFVRWAGEIADVPNKAGFFRAVDQVAARTDKTRQLEAMLEQYDLSWDEAVQAMQSMGAQKQGMMAAAGGGGGGGNGAVDPGRMLV